MKHFFTIAIVILINTLFIGCSSVQPPKRPVAYITPSVVPLSTMRDMKPVKADVQFVSALLEKSNLMPLLTEAGMRKLELSIVARGLSERGYAEIDCRKTNSILRWVSFSNGINDLTVRASFSKCPPLKYISKINTTMETTFVPQTFNREVFYVHTYENPPFKLLRVCSPDTMKTVRWELVYTAVQNSTL